VSSATVKQRLKLASVSPKILDLYEKEEIGLEQVMDFWISDDHVPQEQVWQRIANTHMQELYIKRLRRRPLFEPATAGRFTSARKPMRRLGVILRDLFEQDSGC
jgi:ParB family transcriptional regulator, chromosome partitioning protein